jgi:hypothetical protein
VSLQYSFTKAGTFRVLAKLQLSSPLSDGVRFEVIAVLDANLTNVQTMRTDVLKIGQNENGEMTLNVTALPSFIRVTLYSNDGGGDSDQVEVSMRVLLHGGATSPPATTTTITAEAASTTIITAEASSTPTITAAATTPTSTTTTAITTTTPSTTTSPSSTSISSTSSPQTTTTKSQQQQQSPSSSSSSSSLLIPLIIGGTVFVLFLLALIGFIVWKNNQTTDKNQGNRLCFKVVHTKHIHISMLDDIEVTTMNNVSSSQATTTTTHDNNNNYGVIQLRDEYNVGDLQL